MNEQECLSRMIAPGMRRKGKYREGVIQIHVTRACDKACFNCTQGSNFAGAPYFMSVEHFEQACASLKGYFGVVGVFGGNPAVHPQFVDLCEVMRKHFPFEQRGLWCNNPLGKAKDMRITFNPAVSNLNVHLDKAAYEEFKRDWPESRPFGLDQDSRHSPVFVALKDVLKKQCPDCDFGQRDLGDRCTTCSGTGKVYDEDKAWELISNCDINKHWSAMLGVFRGQLRAWFCEVAGAQSILHQWDMEERGPDGEMQYVCPDTGIDLSNPNSQALPPDQLPTKEGEPLFTLRQLAWWEYPMVAFSHQVRKHCHECGVPLRGYGTLAQDPSPDATEIVSAMHQQIAVPKRKGRRISLVTLDSQLGTQLDRMTDYMGNAKK